LTNSAPFSPYEFLYCLNSNEVQEQVRSLIFIQSTLGTLGNRIQEITIRIPERTAEWEKKIHAFQHNIEMRAECLYLLKQNENSFEL
jgi:type I restriction enzyme M protein